MIKLANEINLTYLYINKTNKPMKDFFIIGLPIFFLTIWLSMVIVRKLNNWFWGNPKEDKYKISGRNF